MVEFDVGRALLITYYGMGVAFSVLAFLIVFILILKVASRRWNPAAAAVAMETPAEAAQGVSILEATGDSEETFLADGFETASEVEDWKSYGRWEALLSRRARSRSN
ncbi:MAG: OadG family protein [Chloroflexi bacterium]|nr:OadG family protein [Chloroflexota bacterium]